ncbi:WLM-domain-containing protein [Periconia macrospinosa]|uniref:WLM-domain-containing protein n=1 Tax=Periconia macrospinosa TaxID=97972 RepID=A0A2V1ECD9_9PLEO|nr:WLM-domain-containing protein [Periconia macrospinosa]
MPLGFERLNERTQRPNALINFIRPLPGPTSSTAENILNRVAAICYPFMKSNMVLVQALEEFPYNTEFVGRNFNAGEVIQLVLKDRNGRWLPQKMVEMVMVHELAHCKQMNHSKAFWKVRDAYAVELRALWTQGYTGEGMWGRGRNLQSGLVQGDTIDPGDIPEHLCGGTYGRRSKKRRRGGNAKDTLSYAEKKQRRILKKFGAGGQALGADDSVKVKLEGGTTKKSKPRVAGSARGRDLRAAAALARFEAAAKENASVKEETPSDSESGDDYEEDTDQAAIDVDGKEMTDEKGRSLIRICDEEDDKDDNAQREMLEIQELEKSKATTATTGNSRSAPSPNLIKTEAASSPRITEQSASKHASTSKISERAPAQNLVSKSRAKLGARNQLPVPTTLTCNVCSLVNELGSVTCMACSNVLNPNMVPEHWKCSSAACEGSQFINSGDAGRCGACGAARGPKPAPI